MKALGASQVVSAAGMHSAPSGGGYAKVKGARKKWRRLNVMFSAGTVGDTRIRSFDGLHAICISGVVLLHYSGNAYSGWLGALSKRGWFGVDIFFVLSGFLITQILLPELDSKATINLPRFYIRRALRLQPAYFSVLLLVLADEFLRRDLALLSWLPFCLT
jgi:peptidoglycan/LPS O-acetylase OafA/YrhL